MRRRSWNKRHEKKPRTKRIAPHKNARTKSIVQNALNRRLDLSDVDERLREWAFFFRDIKARSHCASIEHKFRATSEDFGPNGWGDMESAPQVRRSSLWSLREALKTHDAINGLDKPYKWALTYAFCYPSLPRFIVLRAMKRWTGRRLSWSGFCDLTDIARIRLAGPLRGPMHDAAFNHPG